MKKYACLLFMASLPLTVAYSRGRRTPEKRKPYPSQARPPVLCDSVSVKNKKVVHYQYYRRE